MIKGFLVKKGSMTQKYRQDGVLIPITVCRAGPCVVIGVRTKEKDGYWAVQLAAGRKKRSKKPLLGQLKKAGIKFIPEIIKEFRLEKEDDLPKVGEEITVDQVIKPGAIVKATGITKGRGFAGVMKRHGFGGGRATHGGKCKRRPGSIGCSATPSKVIRGKKLPGHYGNVRRTTRNLEIIDIRPEQSLILLKGSVPGSKFGIIEVKKLKFGA